MTRDLPLIRAVFFKLGRLSGESKNSVNNEYNQLAGVKRERECLVEKTLNECRVGRFINHLKIIVKIAARFLLIAENKSNQPNQKKSKNWL